MAVTTFSGPVVSKNGFISEVGLLAPQAVFAGSTVTHTATDNKYCFIVDTNDSNKLKFSNGTAWKDVDLT